MTTPALPRSTRRGWPFELVLGGVVGHTTAAAGAVAAGAWQRINGKG